MVGLIFNSLDYPRMLRVNRSENKPSHTLVVENTSTPTNYGEHCHIIRNYLDI